MKIVEITVTAGRTFNHPFESYSNLRPEVVLRAQVAEGEDVFTATRALQSHAETLVEDHKRGLLKSLNELEEMRRGESELKELGQLIQRSQDRLNELRAAHPQLALNA